MTIRGIVALAATVWCVAGCATQSPAQVSPEDTQKITDAAPNEAPARPEKPRKVLVYTRANGFVHGSIPYGAKAVEVLGQKTGAWTATVSDDPANFEPDALKEFDAVVLVNTTDAFLRPKDFDGLPAEGKKAALERENRLRDSLLKFVRDGKGLAGFHAATDAYWKDEHKWPDFVSMIGGAFAGHPWGAGDTVTVQVEDPGHPVVAAFGGHAGHMFDIKDEIYQFKDYSREKQRVLLGLEMNKTPRKGGMNRQDNDYAVAWVKNFGNGRVFYSSLGHNNHIYWNPEVLRHYLAGIQFAIGDLKADTRPLPKVAQVVNGRKIYQPFAMNDTVMGEYVGTYLPAPQAAVAPRPAHARVVAEGNNNYRVIFSAQPLFNTSDEGRIEVSGPLKDGKISLLGKTGDKEYSGMLAGDTLKLSGAGEFDLKKTPRQVSTLGQRPPAGAVVLLPYAPGGAPTLDEWRNQNWLPMSDGSIMVYGGDNHTRREFGDLQLHLEWMTPYMPDARGQGRGNSGVYLQDRYEVQVLDSFGFGPADNHAGGIYKVSQPKIDAVAPPGTWQTYDIIYRAPRLSPEGTIQQHAVVTVKLNGQTIHENQELFHPTGGGAGGFTARGPIKLQDHGNPVRYRNIWAVELTPQQAKTAFVAADAAWKPLFSGKAADLQRWTGKQGGWKIENGGILAAQKNAGDLWTKARYGNFVLDLDYKVAPGSNSGVFIRTDNTRNWLHTGIEVQVMDSHGKQPGKHSAGAIYDVLAPSREMSRPNGQWNHLTITARDNKIYVVLNGEQVVDMNLDDWKEAHKNPDGSANKFNTAYKDMKRAGHIGLQYHGNPVWFRNIRIKPLN